MIHPNPNALCVGVFLFGLVGFLSVTSSWNFTGMLISQEKRHDA
ncbi:hypothetical protein AFE_1315 [Acidithiobacillus ferrooxidans ATCC 23270]|uniref:Uncharacterized protein n=1 Tax=Acidithiobacillus ferrooxidans (strain ATCC 23270 / DSM 14882 / CIP 104768 / NCIMB 8455) TaxID=243159 RepID=B7J9B9_ACIF2|nr:hypothetical protein AFE_1315 [Acidithiobacillus ferrooxidans ATCC 23270]